MIEKEIFYDEYEFLRKNLYRSVRYVERRNTTFQVICNTID